MGQFNGHELGEVLQGCGTVQGLGWVNHANVSGRLSLYDSHDVNLVWHATNAAPWETNLSERGGEVDFDVRRAQGGWAPTEEAVAVEVVGTFAVGPNHVVGADREIVSATKAVVADVGTTASGAEVNQHVGVGEVRVGHTEVDTVAFDVGHKEVIGAVAAHHTGHCVAGRVEGVATVPIFIRTVNRHGLRLERSGHIRGSLVIRRG